MGALAPVISDANFFCVADEYILGSINRVVRQSPFLKNKLSFTLPTNSSYGYKYLGLIFNKFVYG
ncbi:hypothetical protein EA687_08160 [Acinetobacter baumannii]|nr:hypothetical protein EA687_08160 [Acinetobacter baumannii]